MTHDKLTGNDTSSAPAIDMDSVVEQFYEPLYRFAFSLTHSASDAADLTQETYRVLLLKRDQLRDPSKLKSWLFTTLYRNFLGQRRHITRFPEVQVEAVDSELPPVDDQTVASVDAQAVVAALQVLDEKYRAPLALFYLQDLSYREIAEVLVVPIGTVMSRLSRGKDLLRRCLSEATSAPVATTVSSPVRGGQTAGLASLFFGESVPSMAVA